MEGSCRYSFEAEWDLAERWPTFSRSLSLSFSLGTFLMRRILKRLRRSVGVEALDRMDPSDTVLPPPSEYPGASLGTLTWSEGGLRVSVMVLTKDLELNWAARQQKQLIKLRENAGILDSLWQSLQTGICFKVLLAEWPMVWQNGSEVLRADISGLTKSCCRSPAGWYVSVHWLADRLWRAALWQ